MANTLMFWNGKLLFVDDKLAMDECCCCAEQCCCCCENPGGTPPPPELDFVISGCFTASGELVEDPDQCWQYSQEAFLPDAGSGCDNAGLFDVKVYCPENANSLSETKLELTTSELSCDYGTATLTASTCEPFKLTFSVPIIQGPDNDCDCAGCSLTVVITIP